MDNHIDTQARLNSFEAEVTQILEGNDRVSSVEFDGAATWTLHLRGCDADEAETVHLEIIDDLTETLGEEACEGLEFSGRRVTEGGTLVLLEVRDEEESGDDEDDGEEGPDGEYSPEVEPALADYLDRLLTLTGKHYFAMGCIISDMAVAVATCLAREKGQTHLDDETFRPMYRCLRRADAPAKQWKRYIDADTNAVRLRLIREEEGCIAAVASALRVDANTAKDILDQYSFDLDEREYPTSSFLRWYRHPRFQDAAE